MFISQPEVRGNRLLAGISASTWKALVPQFELVQLRRNQVLCDCNHTMHYVFFPTTSLISILSVLDDNSSVELATIGREGMAGVQVLSGAATMPYRVRVLSGGFAFRIRAQHLKDAFTQYTEIRQLSMLYMHALFLHVSQVATCHCRHLRAQQVARWILTSTDCAKSDQIDVTQQELADALGSRRESVTSVINDLHSLEIIRHSRGTIKVLDRPELELKSCECYRAIKGEFTRLFPALQPECVAS